MIDRETRDRIMDAANIVEVVSEFVTLRKSGVNYKGLCPFHNERTPSFIVSPSRGTCHCYGCGKGGNSVGFLMEHEQMTYPEALKWLANKYHIEVKERELTQQEREAENDRESMFIVNERAAKYFEETLHEHPDGIAIGMQYLRSRGFRDDTIKTFRLGYDLAQSDALPKTLLGEGFKEKYLTVDPKTEIGTGICTKRESDGRLVDRFAGRVVFPWISISGKVVGFNARKLDQATKGVNVKYINSPASVIYKKERELYGIYFAKKAINKEDKVFIVEGQTDVIAMYQCGIQNVVAGSGTAFSEHQTRTLRRFTKNITLIYDNDDAGRHAAMERIDMMLREGINLKMLFLPEGEDPDSFSRKHTADELKQYIADHEQDCLAFKIDYLLKGVSDPIQKAEGVNSIVKSLSVIPDTIVRAAYLTDCARRLNMNEATLINAMNKIIRGEKEGKTISATPTATSSPTPISITSPVDNGSASIEEMLIETVIRHGEEVIFDNVEAEDGTMVTLTVAQYISYDLGSDGLTLNNPLYRRILDEAVEHSEERGFQAMSYFTRHPDPDISSTAVKLSQDRVQLSESLQMKEEEDSLRQRVEHIVLDFRLKYVDGKLKEIKAQVATADNDPERLTTLMNEYNKMQTIRNYIAKKLGNNIIL